MIRVVLADDQALVRSGFRVLIDAAEDMEVVGEAGDGAEAIELIRRTGCDVALLDIRMPGMDGLRATRAITAEPGLDGTRIVILTTFEIDEYVYQALRAGASGFLGKGVKPAELLAGIRSVVRGDALLSPKATRGLVRHFLESPAHPVTEPRPGIRELTPRERELTVMVAEGLSNTEIAERLFLSPLTVKTHVNRAMVKLGARDRAQLVVISYQSGLVSPQV
ncbi:response regulator transcription factor [Nocardiopsis ganjiahuensis]|uniref:response regulator transcription factor n=1 Tax=Nocardiopsis ganjiahuensis TaxID=239984 RepID=UPI00034B38E9|nr:response regulator transcription factor [Nocardiopsis ganjiahuensis]